MIQNRQSLEEQSVRWKAYWRQSNFKCAVSEENAWCWAHQDFHVVNQKKAVLNKMAGESGIKDKCPMPSK